MKRIIFFLLLAGSLCSCQAIIDGVNDGIYESRAGGHALYFEDWMMGCTTYQATAAAICSRVTYQSESVEEWADPQTTLSRGFGDCDDFAILFMNCYYFGTGEKLDFVLVDTGKTVIEGGDINHAMPYDGETISQYSGNYLPYAVGFLYGFWEVFS